MFAYIPNYAGDPIFGLVDAFNRDTRKDKVNLIIGLYYDDNSSMPLLASVQQAEQTLMQQKQAKLYLSMEGMKSYCEWAKQLIFGADNPSEEIATVQTIGGSGALSLGANFLKRFMPDSAIWISDPSWDNHFAIFQAEDRATFSYPYYDK